MLLKQMCGILWISKHRLIELNSLEKSTLLVVPQSAQIVLAYSIKFSLEHICPYKNTL